MPANGGEWVQINGTTLAALAAVLTSLTGAIGWLMKALLSAKDDQIKSLAEERDFYRDTSFDLLRKGEVAASVADEATRRLRPPSARGAR